MLSFRHFSTIYITCIWPRTKLISFSCNGSQLILGLNGRTCVLAVGYYTSFNAYLLCAWCTSFFVITSTGFLKIIKAYILWENNPCNAGVHNKVAFFIDGLREMQLEDRYYGIWETQLDWRQTFCYFASKGFYSLIWNICDTVFQWGYSLTSCSCGHAIVEKGIVWYGISSFRRWLLYCHSFIDQHEEVQQ